MKRFSIILLGALAILMAGCSKDVHTASKESDDWTINVNLPVPIEFGSASLATKAGISSLADLAATDNFIGIYAVDKKAVSLTAADALLLNNRRACCVLDEENSAANIVFGAKDAQTVEYYPLLSERNYSFYAYYAHNTAGNVDLSEPETTSTQVLVPMSVATRTSDILWAKAEAVEEVAANGLTYDGFNAAYIRKIGKEPVLNFEHVTAQIAFRAVLVSEEGASVPTSVSVKNMHLLDVPVKASLCVMDIAAPENCGEFFNTTNAESTTIYYYGWYGETPTSLKNATSQNLNASDFTDIGEPIYVVPGNDPLTLSMSIEFEINGEKKEQIVSYELNPKDLGSVVPEGKRLFEAGYKYGFNIIIYSPEQIKIDVTVEEYESAFGTDDNGDDVYADITIE